MLHIILIIINILMYLMINKYYLFIILSYYRIKYALDIH